MTATLLYERDGSTERKEGSDIHTKAHDGYTTLVRVGQDTNLHVPTENVIEVYS